MQLHSYEISENIARQFRELGITAISSITNNSNNKSLSNAGSNTFIVYPWVNAKALDKNEVSIKHVHDPLQLCSILKEAGFKDIKMIKPFSRNKKTDGNDKLVIYECRK